MDHHPSRNPARFPPAFPFQQMLELHHQHHQQEIAQQQAAQQQQLSEEEEDNSSSGNKEIAHHRLQIQQAQTNQIQHNQSQKSPAGGGAAGEVVAPARKPRGRPPGSKNKPKPPIIITRETGSGMRPHVLEVSPNTDIVEAIATFARKRQRAICVLSGKGTVSNITLLRHQSPSSPPPNSSSSSAPAAGSSASSSRSSPPSSTVSYHGRFELISLSGAFLQQIPSAGISMAFSGLAVSVAGGPQGQVIGGNVAGPLIAASPVIVIAASFAGPSYDRLPLEEDDQDERIDQGQQGNQQASQSTATQQQQIALQGNSPPPAPPTIPIHQLMNDPFGLAAAAAAHHHHGMPPQIPPPDLLASWAAAAAAGARPPM